MAADNIARVIAGGGLASSLVVLLHLDGQIDVLQSDVAALKRAVGMIQAGEPGEVTMGQLQDVVNQINAVISAIQRSLTAVDSELARLRTADESQAAEIVQIGSRVSRLEANSADIFAAVAQLQIAVAALQGEFAMLPRGLGGAGKRQ